ncbi:MAG TPA: hypothetical protein VIX87_06595 [Steroidobacteraceae bacterium]
MNTTFWIHEISQSALAGAVAMLGIVILLELRSVLRLRRSVDGHLSRVFEQLDLLRFENQQLMEAQARAPSPARPEPPSTPAVTVASSPPLGGGEARLMAALAAARARSVVHQKTA